MFKWQPPRESFHLDDAPTAPRAEVHKFIQDGAHPLLAVNLVKFLWRMRALDHQPALVQLWRSAKTQNELYAQGRTKPGKIVTDARPWQSAHCSNYDGAPASQAFDIAPKVDNRIYWPMDEQTQIFWSDARDTGTMLGLVWGATFNTPPRDFGHFQLSTFKAQKP